VEIGKQQLIIERPDLRAEVDIEIAFGESGMHSGSCRFWHCRQRVLV
jgi:hypothetical protein